MMHSLVKSTSPFLSLRYGFSSGANFLTMVESFFDRAASHTGIKNDLINYYKKSDNVLKCSLPLVRGKF